MRLFIILVLLSWLLLAQGHQAFLAWQFTQGDGPPTPTSFNVKRGLTAGGPYATIGSVPATANTYTDTTAAGGQTYYYVIAAVANATEFAQSNEFKAVVPMTVSSIAFTGMVK